MTLSVGMQADYASLIDKQQLDSLKMIGVADTYAKKLLVVNPDAADAYLGLGTANYIIGSLPGLEVVSWLRWNPRRRETGHPAA